MEFEIIREKLNRIRLREISDIKCGDALYYVLYENTPYKKSIPYSILRILYNVIFYSINVDKRDEADIGFLYSNSYKDRNDLFNAFSMASSLHKKRIVILQGKRVIHIKGKILFLGLLWYKKLRKEFSAKESIYYTSMLAFGYRNMIDIISALKTVTAIIVFSDFNLIDSFVVQRAKKLGKITATMQHGNFETEEPFRLSKSDYFLGYGKYTKQVAMMYGIKESHFIEVGMPKFIKYLPDTCSLLKCDKIRTIGILCSGGKFVEADTKMINLVIDAAKICGLGVYVKLHPNFPQKLYPNVRWEDIDKIYEKEINIEKFKEMIDVAVVYRSTVFIEYIMQLFPTLIYKTYNDDCFKSIKWCKFTSKEQLVALIRSIELSSDEFINKMKMTRLMFSDIKNVSDNYVKAYQFLLNGGLFKT